MGCSLPFAKLNSDGREEFESLAEPANRFTYLEASKKIQRLESREYRSGFSSISMVDFVIKTNFYALPFPSYSPFYETFNKKIDQMLSNGIIDHWIKNDYNPRGMKMKKEEIEPQILTFDDHLDVGFLMCLSLLGISFLVLCAEIICSVIF